MWRNEKQLLLWKHPKPISLETVKIKALVRQIFNDSKRAAGARSIVAILMNEHNIKLTRYMAGKLMAQMGLKADKKSAPDGISDALTANWGAVSL
ncbi:transposase [Psychrobacter sp. 16-MNA-CIBAN-0192]|uniref:transposase n=1 Tax=Psychrobacter sp. 16-MNA-CIBAN-0192 TaxID=3140448 RepID=UPI00331E1094